MTVPRIVADVASSLWPIPPHFDTPEEADEFARDVHAEFVRELRADEERERWPWK